MYDLGPLSNIGQIPVCLKHLLPGGIKPIRQVSEIENWVIKKEKFLKFNCDFRLRYQKIADRGVRK